MARALKIAGLVLAAVLLIAILYLWFADFSSFKPKIEAAVSEATGREFRIDGDFSVDVLPSPVVLVSDATLSNAAWATDPTMVRIGRFSTEIGLWSLLFRPIVVRDLVLDDVTVNLEVDAEGKTNWEFGGIAEEEEPEETDDGSMESPVDLRHAQVRNVKVVYRRPELDDLVFDLASFSVQGDESGARTFNAAAQLDDLPITLDGTSTEHKTDLTAKFGDVKLRSTSRFDGNAVDFDLSLGTLAQVGTLVEVDNLPEDDLSLKGHVDVEGPLVHLSDIVAELGTLKVDLDGTIDTSATTVGLTVAATGENLDMLGPALPKLPFSVNTEVALAENRIDLDPLAVTFGESALDGKLNAALGDVPAIELAARSSLVDLSPFFPADEEGNGEAQPDKDADSGEYVFKDEPLPLDTLQKATGKVDVRIDRLKFSNTEYADFVVRMDLEHGQLDIDNSFSGKYGGAFANKLDVTFSDSTADLDIDVSADGMKLVALAGPDLDEESIPTSAVDLKVKASGNSPRALAASADGKVLFMQGPGRMDNALIGKLSGDIIAQLFSALNPFAKDEQYTNWDCSVFGIDFDSGAGEISTFLLEGEKIMVVGGGTIDLNTEKLNIEFNTKPRKGVGISADMFVTPFVALSGTLANPHVGLNAKGALLSGGAAVLTGGLSFLYQGLADRATAETGKCDETFKAIGEPVPGTSK